MWNTRYARYFQKMVGMKYSCHIKAESPTRELNLIDYACYCMQVTSSFSIRTWMNYNLILKVYDKKFSRFGLTIAIDKTKTLALSLNVAENVMTTKSPILLRGEPIVNVRNFK